MTYAPSVWRRGIDAGRREGAEAERNRIVALLREPDDTLVDEIASNLYELLRADPRMKSMTSFDEIDEGARDIFRQRATCTMTALAGMITEQGGGDK